MIFFSLASVISSPLKICLNLHFLFQFSAQSLFSKSFLGHPSSLSSKLKSSNIVVAIFVPDDLQSSLWFHSPFSFSLFLSFTAFHWPLRRYPSLSMATSSPIRSSCWMIKNFGTSSISEPGFQGILDEGIWGESWSSEEDYGNWERGGETSCHWCNVYVEIFVVLSEWCAGWADQIGERANKSCGKYGDHDGSLLPERSAPISNVSLGAYQNKKPSFIPMNRASDIQKMLQTGSSRSPMTQTM